MLNHDFCQSLLPFKKAKIVYTVIILSFEKNKCIYKSKSWVNKQEDNYVLNAYKYIYMLSIDQCYACGHCSYAFCILQAMWHQILQAMWSNLWEKMSLGNNGFLLTVISGTWQIYCILVVVIELLISQT